MELVKSKIFQNETVTVDNKQFVDCDFVDTSLVYNGGILPKFDRCYFNGVSLQFGDAAASTLRFLSGLRSGGFMPAVDKLLEGVRK